MQKAAVVKLFWTGGWDSTFRVLQLLIIEKADVEPYYIIDLDRHSTMIELKTMAHLRRLICARLDDPTLLHPLQVRMRCDYSIPDEIARAFAAIRRQMHIGDQCEWMAAFCAHKDNHGIETTYEPSPEQPEQSVQAAIRRMVAGEPVDPAIRTIFGNMAIALTTLTKAEMARIAREHGFHHILSASWSCHRPIREMPCGYCRPCQLLWERGEPVRFSRLRLPARVYRLAQGGVRRLRSIRA